jgi:hypothetical protein
MSPIPSCHPLYLLSGIAYYPALPEWRLIQNKAGRTSILHETDQKADNVGEDRMLGKGNDDRSRDYCGADKPRSLYSIQQRVAPGQKGTEELQVVLMRLRDEKKVKFDINSGRWSRASGEP